MKVVLLLAVVLASCAAPSSAQVIPSGTSPVAETTPELSGAPQSSVPSRTVPPEAEPSMPDRTQSGAPKPTGGIGLPASYCKPGYCEEPAPELRIGNQRTLAGTSTWYDWHPGEAAAGPGLRRWLGPNWRGTVVTVISPGCTCRPVVVRLTDWCLCKDDRVIDLDAGSFAQLSDLRTGIIRVLILEGDWR